MKQKGQRNTCTCRNMHTHTQKLHKNTKFKTIISKQKTSKLNVQTKYFETHLQKYHRVCFVLVIQGLTSSTVYLLNKFPLEKIIFFLVSGSHMEIASGLGIEASVHFPLQHWDPICLELFHKLMVN